ncbi:hypothetical protein [Erwinia pyrifoliae]|nr:hypothetical protein [Erwinia pyrifoliae]MCT2385991.1 hypothetical protein [Erwinia pyrifoliae]
MLNTHISFCSSTGNNGLNHGRAFLKKLKQVKNSSPELTYRQKFLYLNVKNTANKLMSSLRINDANGVEKHTTHLQNRANDFFNELTCPANCSPIASAKEELFYFTDAAHILCHNKDTFDSESISEQKEIPHDGSQEHSYSQSATLKLEDRRE